jgi:hypothetical protein
MKMKNVECSQLGFGYKMKHKFIGKVNRRWLLRKLLVWFLLKVEVLSVLFLVMTNFIDSSVNTLSHMQDSMSSMTDLLIVTPSTLYSAILRKNVPLIKQ